MSSTACEIAGITLKNPLIAASGTFGFGREYAKLYPIANWGGVSSKGITLHPRSGNRGLRVYETASGMMNSVGLENPGIEAFIERELEWMLSQGTTVLLNLGGNTIEDYIEGAALLSDACQRLNARDALLELNISCPNVKQGGMAFGLHTETARTVVREVRSASSLPLIVKLSPNAQDVVGMAVMCQDEGADAVSLINTFQAMKIDIRRRRSVFDSLYAGLSGPAIKPIALRMTHQVAQAVLIPIIGMGGISSAEDVLEFVMAGATAVQIGTYNFVNLRAGETLPDELSALLEELKISSLEEIRGIV